MAESSLLRFITMAKQQGAEDQFLVGLLTAKGWPQKRIYQAFATYYETATGEPIPARAGAAESAKDAFVYLLSFCTLAVWARALGAILYTLIDIWFPDPISPNSGGYTNYDISSDIASIIVAFPIYLYATSLSLKEIRLHPEKRESSGRQWISYVALLLTASCIIGTLVTFLAYFLRGELSSRFLLKVLVVLGIAGCIFWYYLASLQRSGQERESD
jgi:hypothetical protein